MLTLTGARFRLPQRRLAWISLLPGAETKLRRRDGRPVFGNSGRDYECPGDSAATITSEPLGYRNMALPDGVVGRQEARSKDLDLRAGQEAHPTRRPGFITSGDAQRHRAGWEACVTRRRDGPHQHMSEKSRMSG